MSTPEHAHPLPTCAEYRALSRRGFLVGSPVALAGLASAARPFAPSPAPAPASGGANRDVLVTVFLRGAIDGLSALVPHGDADYYGLRPTIAVPPPGSANGALDLDGFFGLPPTGAPLLAPYANGHLLCVHGAGSPDPTRSHFESMLRIETATPNQPTSTIFSGWLARHLHTSAPLGGPLRAAALGDLVPRHLATAPATLPIPDPESFGLPGDAGTDALRRSTLESLYVEAVQPLAGAAATTLGTFSTLEAIDFAGYVPSGGAVYPLTEFGRALRNAAALIKANIGVESVHVDFGGWDHHENLAPLDGVFAYHYAELCEGLAAFYADMLALVDDYTLVVQSEFGRRAAENGSLGTDHGHGNMMLVLGGHIDGGRVLASWPGLDAPNLDQGDLQVNIDYRDILAEIVLNRLGNTNLDAVFPGHTPAFHGITV
jgi:uncharacterized protein (DUF1501 family)